MTGITHTEDVTPSNTVDLQHECSAIYVGTGGDVAGVETNGGVSLYKNVPSGAYIYGIFRRVNATGTNAADMIASRGLVPLTQSAGQKAMQVWNELRTWQGGEVVIDRGGEWEAQNANTNSRPISGNADWTLVGGTPYVDVTLDPVALTTAPFVDASYSGPGILVIPTPPAGFVNWPLSWQRIPSAGDAWDIDPLFYLVWGDDTGGYSFESGAATGLAAATPNPIYETFRIDDSGGDEDIANYAIRLSAGAPDPVISGGTRSVKLRLTYTILQASSF